MYLAVGNRCAVDFNKLKLSVPLEQALSILERKGFQKIDVDIIALARSFIGSAKYRRGARLSEAPEIFDCSSLIKWLYAQKGIWLPRRSIQQRKAGLSIKPEDLKGGDAVFTSGLFDYYETDPLDGVGHVGLATGDGTVVHAANSKFGIIEDPFDEYIKRGFRGTRRIIPDNSQVFTFATPPEQELECSDDFRWIIFEYLHRM